MSKKKVIKKNNKKKKEMKNIKKIDAALDLLNYKENIKDDDYISNLKFTYKGPESLGNVKKMKPSKKCREMDKKEYNMYKHEVMFGTVVERREKTYFNQIKKNVDYLKIIVNKIRKGSAITSPFMKVMIAEFVRTLTTEDVSWKKIYPTISAEERDLIMNYSKMTEVKPANSYIANSQHSFITMSTLEALSWLFENDMIDMTLNNPVSRFLDTYNIRFLRYDELCRYMHEESNLNGIHILSHGVLDIITPERSLMVDSRIFYRNSMGYMVTSKIHPNSICIIEYNDQLDKFAFNQSINELFSILISDKNMEMEDN